MTVVTIRMPALDVGMASQEVTFCPSVGIYNSVIHSVNDMLIYQQFEECYQLARKFSLIAKNNLEDPKSVSVLDALMTVSIQALAEMNRWSEVIPYVCHMYDGLESSPAAIAKLCIQLHMKLKDQKTCGMISSIWLRHPPNITQSGYVDILDLYIDEVLVPTGSWDLIRSILEVHPNPDPSVRETRWRKIQAIRRQQQLLSADRIEVLESSSDSSQVTSRANDGGTLPVLLQSCLRKVTDTVRRCLPRSYIFTKYLRNLCIACVLVYILVKRWRTAILPDSMLGRLLVLVQKLWRGMFTPFYMSSG